MGFVLESSGPVILIFYKFMFRDVMNTSNFVSY